MISCASTITRSIRSRSGSKKRELRAKWGIFADWTCAFPGGGVGEDDLEDYQIIRGGFRVNF
jgi:hypothetical protein